MDNAELTMAGFADFFRILANQSRFNILKTLVATTTELSVTQLAQTAKVPMSKISDQLMVLRRHNLTTFKKDRTIVHYTADMDMILSNNQRFMAQLTLPSENYYIHQIVKHPMSDESYLLYKVLANETRCELMVKIAQKERYVNELCDMFYLEQPTISMHLNTLKRCHLLGCRKHKTNKYYYISPLK